MLKITATDLQRRFNRQTRLEHFHLGFFFCKPIRVLRITYNLAVSKLYNTVAVSFGKFSIVGNEYDELFLCDILQYLKNAFSGLRVQCASRLVCKNDFRIFD